MKSYFEFINEGEAPTKHIALKPEQREIYKSKLKKVIKECSRHQAIIDKSKLLKEITSMVEEIIDEWNKK